jgi:hypothetical protein
LAAFLICGALGDSARFPVVERIARADTVFRTSVASPGDRVARLQLEATIGDRDSLDKYAFDNIGSVLVAADNSIWVVDGGILSPRLRRYSESGAFLQQIGRRGEGPGEYEAPGGLAQMRDGRVLLRDGRGNRVNVYTSSGRIDTTWTFQRRYPWTRSSAGSPWVDTGVDTTGVVWMRFESSMSSQGSGSAFVRLRRDGSIIDTVPVPHVLRAGERASLFVSSGRFVIPIAAPYQSHASWAWHPRGNFATYNSSSYILDVRVGSERSRGAGGVNDRVIRIQRTIPRVVVTPAEAADQRAYLRASVAGQRTTGTFPEIPDSKPPIRSVRFSAEGRIWVQISTNSERFDPGVPASASGGRPRPVLKWRERPVFEVFEADGAFIGRVAFPVGAQPVFIRGETVWCVARNDEDMLVLQRYRVLLR